MPSGDRQTNFHNTKLLSRQDIYNNFFQLLDNKIKELTSGLILDQPCILGDQKIDLTSGANDTFYYDITNADKCADSNGNILDLSNLAPYIYSVDVDFENATGITYYFGLKYATIVDTLTHNHRTGEPEYANYIESAGELGHPDSVAIVGGVTLRLVIDGILENGVDHSGNDVIVWLETPVTSDDTQGIYYGVVAYDAGTGENRINISYGADGPLGQKNPPHPISLNELNYWVHIPGASWFKTKDLRNDSDYIFVGTIVGNGPAATPVTFNITEQRVSVVTGEWDELKDGITYHNPLEKFFVKTPATGPNTYSYYPYTRTGPGGAFPMSGLCTDGEYLYYAQDLGANLQVGNLDPSTGLAPTNNAWYVNCGSGLGDMACDGAYLYIGATGVNALRKYDRLTGNPLDLTGHGANPISRVDASGKYVICVDTTTTFHLHVYSGHGDAYDGIFNVGAGQILDICISGDVGYFVNVNGLNFDVFAIDLTSRTQIWSNPNVTVGPISQARVCCDGKRLYVGHTRQTFGGIQRAFTAYDLGSGNEIWTLDNVTNLDNEICCDQDRVYACDGSNTLVLDKTSGQYNERMLTADNSPCCDGVSVYGYFGNSFARYWTTQPIMEYQRVSADDGYRIPWSGMLAIPTGRNL